MAIYKNSKDRCDSLVKFMTKLSDSFPDIFGGLNGAAKIMSMMDDEIHDSKDAIKEQMEKFFGTEIEYSEVDVIRMTMVAEIVLMLVKGNPDLQFDPVALEKAASEKLTEIFPSITASVSDKSRKIQEEACRFDRERLEN